MKFPLELAKPTFGSSCNGCGYCCAVQPCMLAQEFLNCSTGPCVALEIKDGRTTCGLVRNPLGYLYKAANPEDATSVLDPAPDIENGRDLSASLAATLGIGIGCDADDDADSARWPVFPIWAQRAGVKLPE